MQNATRLGRAIVLAATLTGTLVCITGPAAASSHHNTLRHGGTKVATGSASRHNARYVYAHGSRLRYAHASYGGLQCVPFARAASGIELKGNAANWWDAAAGVYQRGSAPEPGSVLNFRATYGMRLGHVAVVTAVDDTRHIQVEHANWYKGSISRNTTVEDVSPSNDWSEVRVAIGGGNFGSTYPTYGFIYDRPDSGVMVASAHPDVGGAPQSIALAAGVGGKIDLPQTGILSTASVQDAGFTEVAEAPLAVNWHHVTGRHGHWHTQVEASRHVTAHHGRDESRPVVASAHRVSVSHRLVLKVADRR